MTGVEATTVEGEGWRLVRAGSGAVVVHVTPERAWPLRLLHIVWLLGLVVGVATAWDWSVGIPALRGSHVFLVVLAFQVVSPALGWWLRGRETLRIVGNRLEFERRRLVRSHNSVIQRRGDAAVVEVRVTTNAIEHLALTSRERVTLTCAWRQLAFGVGLSSAAARDLGAAIAVQSSVIDARKHVRSGPAVPRRVASASADGAPAHHYGDALPTDHPARYGRRGRDVVLGVGGLGLAVVLGVLATARHASTEALAVAAIGLALIGVWFAPGGGRQRLRRRRMDAARIRHPDALWLWDPYGFPQVQRLGVARRAIETPALWVLAGLVTIGVAMLLSAVNPWTRWPLEAAFCTLLATMAVVQLANVAFAGDTEMRFGALPSPPGGPLTVHFSTARRGATFESIRFRLVRLEERTGPTHATHVVVCTHAADQTLPEDAFPPGPGEEVTVRFDLPKDLPPTDLVGPRASWWEVEVHGETSCGTYDESFRAPIFAAGPSVTER